MLYLTICTFYGRNLAYALTIFRSYFIRYSNAFYIKYQMTIYLYTIAFLKSVIGS